MRAIWLFLAAGCGIAWIFWGAFSEDHTARRSVPRAIPAASRRPDNAAIRGRVVASETGRPIRGARVRIDNAEAVTTDADGRFEAAGAGKQVSIQVDAERFASIGCVRSMGEQPFLFELERGYVVSGRVVNKSGQPVPRIQVSTGFRRARTDEDGAFSIGGHVAGRVQIQAWGADDVTVEAGTDDAVLVVSGSHLRIRARDETGRPLRGVEYISDDLRWVTAGGEASSEFVMLEFEPGESVSVVLRKRGYLPSRLTHFPRSRAPGVFEETVTLRRRPPHSLRLDVHHFDGTPAKVAHVRLYDAENLALVEEDISLTDGSGVFHRLPAGAYRLWVHGDDDDSLGVVIGVDIRPGDDNRARVNLRPGASLRVMWTRYASKYRLMLYSLDDATRRYTFGPRANGQIWGMRSRIPLGRYRLVELRAREVMRETELDLRTTDVHQIDWSED